MQFKLTFKILNFDFRFVTIDPKNNYGNQIKKIISRFFLIKKNQDI